MNTPSLNPSTPQAHGLDAGEVHFQQLAEGSEDVFWLANMLTQRLVYVNSRFEHFWGLPGQALLDDPQHWNRAVDSADATILPTPFFADDLAQGNIVREYRIRTPNGQCRWMRDRRFQWGQSRGWSVHIGGIVQDVTASRQTQGLTGSHDRYLAAIAHELRSPLNALRSWIHVLRRSGPLTADQSKALDAIDRNTQGQARMIAQLLGTPPTAPDQ
ncbi:MAG: PAS domain-containing protein [Burkholderiales bacterium]|nr:PAS domain-containing protein [Burkholderiales bacterium]